MLLLRRLCCVLMPCLVLAACSSPTRRAPIEDRPVASSPAATHQANLVVTPPSVTVQTDGAGYHTVRQGETLYGIASAYGRDHRDLFTWNQLSDASVIRVGQVIRVAPPESGTVAPVRAPGDVESRPLVTAPPAPQSQTATISADPRWMWPAHGTVIERFDETRNKGIDIAGKVGDPVVASADGKVVYAGNGLRAYGNLVIIKHDDDFISAYAHNSKLLVRLNEPVKRGQRIAEMGNTDAERPKLHFELRRGGKPIDPLKFLPERK